MNSLLIGALLAGLVAEPQVGTAGTISGQVRSATGQILEGIRVAAMVAPEPGVSVSSASTLVSVVMSDGSGRYKLENVPPGRYYITAGMVDMPAYYPGVRAMDKASIVTVEAGAALTNIDFAGASLGVRVSGRVQRSTGTAGVPIRIAIQSTQPSGQIPDTAVNPDGTFQFINVRPGNYTLRLLNGVLARPFNLIVTDEDIAGIELVGLTNVPITGTLAFDADGPRPRITISLIPFAGGVPQVSPTFTNGAMRGTIPEGAYRVSWSALPPGFFLKSVRMGEVDLLKQPLVAAAGLPPVEVTVGVSSPPPWVKLRGRVTGVPNVPNAPAAHLMLASVMIAEPVDVALNPDGTFEVPKILPGNYTASITPAVPLTATTIVVPSRDFDGVAITIPPLKELTGRILTEGSDGPKTVPLTFLDAGNGVTATRVQAVNGTFRVTLPIGDRRYTVNAAGYTVKAYRQGTADLSREPMKVRADNDEEIEIVLQSMPLAGALPTTSIVGGLVSGTAQGVIGGIVGGIAGGTGTPLAPTPFAPSLTQLTAEQAQLNLISSVPASSPPLAVAAGVAGSVTMTIVIGADGVVAGTAIVAGHPLLNDAAIAAIRQWRYKPHLVNGQPTAVQTMVTVSVARP